jgi:hypothetical protein
MRKSLFFTSLLLIFLFVTTLIIAQDYDPPKDVNFEKAEDYVKYQPEILKCIEFLENSDLSRSEKRLAANDFFMKWLIGSPNVMVELPAKYILDYTKINKAFLIIFMDGWTKYQLENPANKDKVKGNLAGLRAIIRVYTLNKSAQHDDAVETLIALDKNGKLEEWIIEKLK